MIYDNTFNVHNTWQERPISDRNTKLFHGKTKVNSTRHLPPIVVMCKLLHQQASHLWHVGVDLMHVPKLPMILGCHDFSLAPQLVSQSAGWFSTSSDLGHHLWQSKDAIPFPPDNHYKAMKVTKQIKYLKWKWTRKQATDLNKSQSI